MNRIVNILLVAILLSFIGCAKKHWVSPAIDGVVIDAQTKEHIGNVKISRVFRGDNKSQFVGDASDNGVFKIDAKKENVISVVFWGDPAHFGHYLFSKDGYKSEEYHFGLITGEVYQEEPPEKRNLTIQLHKN